MSTRAGLVIRHTGHFPGGPTHLRGRQNVFVFLPSCRDSEQPVAHWFVSCIDSISHPTTKRYRRSDIEVFCFAYIPQLLPRWLFPCFHSSFIKNRLALRWVMRAKEPGRRRRGEGWIGKVLDRDSQRRQASKYPNVCVRFHDCRIRKLFLIKPKFVRRDFYVKLSVFIEVSTGQCELISI